MDVHVRRPCTDGPNQLTELAGGEPLSGRPRADVRGPDRAADRPAPRWTSLGPGRPIAEIRAQEDDDRAGVRLVLEMDVRLCRRGFEASVGQLVADLAGPAVDRRPELSDPERRQCGDLLISGQPRANALPSAGPCNGHYSDRNCADSDYGESELAA